MTSSIPTSSSVTWIVSTFTASFGPCSLFVSPLSGTCGIGAKNEPVRLDFAPSTSRRASVSSSAASIWTSKSRRSTALSAIASSQTRLERALLWSNLCGVSHSDVHLECILRLLMHCLDIAEHYRLQLDIEKIPCTSSGPLTNVKRAFEQATRSRFAFATEFLTMHNSLASARRLSLRTRVRMSHFCCGDSRLVLFWRWQIGEGYMDPWFKDAMTGKWLGSTE